MGSDILDTKHWDEQYQDGEVVWDTGRPATELKRVIREHQIAPCRILEIGCGAGDTAIWLAAQGFEVVAIDRPQFLNAKFGENGDNTSISFGCKHFGLTRHRAESDISAGHVWFNIRLTDNSMGLTLYARSTITRTSTYFRGFILLCC